jgi:predicted nucleotide-binding protein (sugar kinase/HSP70/actin superfamily)
VHFFGDVDVICDIGGQDIKVLFMQNGDIKNFRLSNQCSAGNGMLLQAMADQFGISVRDYAETAFGAALSPKFSYGCAVFLDSDRVNFQKEGYSKEELLAGLAMVLPKNVWQYVVQIPRMAELGKKFVLQGGTQYNLAAVKAQVDYILERVPGAEVYVHPHTGEAGAIGAAMETLRVVKRRGFSTFIGLESAIDLEYTSKNDEETRCHFCPNECSRTFIDTKTPDGDTARYISGFSCEKGTVEDLEALKQLQKKRNGLKKAYPNLVDVEASLTFKHFFDGAPLPEPGTLIDDVVVEKRLLSVKKTSVKRGFRRASFDRSKIRIGIPKVLNIWSTGPFWRTYFETLGVKMQHVVFSDDTSEELWLEGGKYGSIDPCYPSKVAQAHVHNLLFHHHSDEKPLDYLFFPCITHIETQIKDTMDTASCPIVAGAPKVMKAAFTKEIDFFAQRGIVYLDPALSFTEPNLLKRRMFETWQAPLGLTEDESDFACEQAWLALRELDRRMEALGKEILEDVERTNGIALLMIGRPYHSDPGLNHQILDEFQVLGYPVLSMRSIPKDPQWLARFFPGEEPLSVSDVWPENYSANSVQKVWAAKFAARHPNVAVIDLSSFKCGHDAPTYGLVDKIISSAGTPYSALHDIDANKPSGSIKIRVKTYAHSLSLHEERLSDLGRQKTALKLRIEEKRVQLLEMKQQAGAITPALQAELAAAKERMASYQRALVPEEAPAPQEGLVTIRRKGRNHDDSIARSA